MSCPSIKILEEIAKRGTDRAIYFSGKAIRYGEAQANAKKKAKEAVENFAQLKLSIKTLKDKGRAL